MKVLMDIVGALAVPDGAREHGVNDTLIKWIVDLCYSNADIAVY